VGLIANNVIVTNPSSNSTINGKKFEYASAPVIIPEKNRLKEKKVSSFVKHMTTN
jgi:hypothetical protein